MEILEATKPRSLVVLLPDLDGNVGEIEFTNVAGRQTLKSARAATAANKAAEAPTAAFDVEEAALEQRFGAAIKAQPVPPERFILFFELNSAELSESAADQIPRIIDSIARHPAAEVEIFGHADRSGSNAFNDALSLSRANTVRQRIIDQLASDDALRVVALGELEPLVATPDGVVEPQNRRVEVTVR